MLDRHGSGRYPFTSLCAAVVEAARTLPRRVRAKPRPFIGCVVVLAGTLALVGTVLEVRLAITHPLPELRNAGLFVVERGTGAGIDSWSWPAYESWRQQPEFDSVAAEGVATSNVALPDEGTTANLRPVSVGYFSSLGVVVQGRDFTPEDETRGAEPVAVVSRGLLKRLQVDGPTIGRQLRCGGVRVRVVGIVGSDFDGTQLQRPDDIWIPLKSAAAFKNIRADWLFPTADTGERALRWIRILVRVRNGTRPVHPTALANIAPVRFEPIESAAYPASARRGIRFLISVMMIAATMLVLISAAAVGTFLLTETHARRNEFMIRYAIGASAASVLLLVVVDAGAIAALGGASAMIIASWIATLLGHIALPGDVLLSNLSLRWEPATVGLVWLVVLGSLAVSSGAPLWYAWHAREKPLPPRGSLMTGSRVHPAFLAAQTALAVVLTAGAVLFAGSVRGALSFPLGFDSNQVAFFTVGESLGRYDAARKAMLIQQVVDRLNATPGVESATISRTFFGPDIGMTAHAVRVDGETRTIEPNYLERMVGPSIVRVLGLHLVAGRDLSASDTVGRPSVALVTASFSNQAWGGRSAVGRRFSLLGVRGEIEVVGVVGDAVRERTRGAVRPTVFLPVSQRLDDLRTLDCAVRVKGDPQTILPAIQASIATILPSGTVERYRTAREIVEREYALQIMLTAGVLWCAVAAVGIAAVGTYSAVARKIDLKRQEIGVRLCVGATPGQIVRFVVADTTRACGVGCVVGLLLSLVGEHLIESYLEGMSGPPLLAVAGAGCFVFAVASAAGFFSGRTASRAKPADWLRTE